MIAVLVADGTALRAYVRQPGRDVREAGWLHHPALLHAWLGSTHVHTVVLVDGPDAEWYFDTILERADLVVVPPLWLRHLPRRDARARARLAARLALHHRARPLQHYVCTDRQPRLPF